MIPLASRLRRRAQRRLADGGAASRNRCSRRWRKPSAIAPTFCWCSASSPAASSSPFITVHLPSYLIDRGLSAEIGGWTLATIGLFNIIGSFTSGYLGNRMPKRYISVDSSISARALSIVVFIIAAGKSGHDAHLRRRHRPAVAVDGAADLGAGGRDVRHPLAGDAVRLCLLQPPGRRLPRRVGWAACCSSALGSYNPVWWLSVFFGVLSALINLPIVEKPVARTAWRRPDALALAKSSCRACPGHPRL